MDEDGVLERLGPKAALSHEAAARQWGIELLHSGAQHVTVPRQRGGVLIPGWTVHRADLRADEVEVHRGHRLTAPVRTIVDLGRTLVHAEAVVAADSALRLGLVSLAHLLRVTSRARGRGAARLRALGAGVDELSGSVLESLLRVLLASAGLAPARTQYPIYDRDRFIGRVDFAWPAQRVIVEADGFAYHGDRDSYRRDRERDNELERLGWRVLRFTWEDVVRRPDYVIGLVRSVLEAAA